MKFKKYPKIATERFDRARIWIKYIVNQTKFYMSKNVIEIGAGCGSFARAYYRKEFNTLVLTESDNVNLYDLNKIFFQFSNVKIIRSNIKNIKKKFDTIIYFNVLEHIKDDTSEINNAINKLNKNGYLIILVPAHQNLYGNLDLAVGHYRRYNISYFAKSFKNCKIVELKFLDMAGYFLYYFNNLFFKKQTYPSKIKIFIWDKFFTPLTIILDFITFYRFGKNILCVFKKE